ncbi:MAG: fumarate hydratase [Pygmaiobacter massiliensis]|nr:fumarate hydratase [Pygmaiobacter massiliensis]
MREISTIAVTQAVRDACIEANYHLPADVAECIGRCRRQEPFAVAQDILDNIQKNIEVAAEGVYPLCQDTGFAAVFLELGQEVHITGGSLYDAVNEGVRQGYTEGYLRKSILNDPLRRVNTKDNTPAFITTTIVPGDKLRLTVAPKGGGSENMSRLAMLKPSDGVEGVKQFVLETVEKAGPNPCPPIVVGVGVGGTFDQVALAAKRALLRSLDEPNPDPLYAQLEQELLEKINALGIGPQGFGGRTTALGVLIEQLPCHITGLPVAVNISCHVTRHASRQL